MLVSIAAAMAIVILADVLLAIFMQRLLGIPGLGGTPAFAMFGCDYLAWAAAVTKGDFSISLMFETYTFLNSQSSVRYFSSASRHELGLQPAVQHFTQKNFGLSSQLWSEGEARPAHILRKMLAPNQMASRNMQLCRSLLQLRHQYFVHAQVDLVRAIPAWVMHATAEALFGHRFLDEIMPAPLLMEHLQRFDAEFEGAASLLPRFLFPGFTKAKMALLAAFRKAICAGVLHGTIAEAVYCSSGVPQEQYPNTLLALLWAGLTNVSVTVFWAVAFLLLPEHTRWRCSVQQQMAATRAAVAEGLPLQDTVDATVHGALAQGEASVLHGCVSEALRLRAQGIVLRKAVKPLRIPQRDIAQQGSTQVTGSLAIPAGRLVAISPYQIHHDPRFFRDPSMFDPFRHGGVVNAVATPAATPAGCTGTHGQVGGGMAAATRTAERPQTRTAFGAGPFRCPGRAMAMAEATLAVGIFFSCYNACLQQERVPGFSYPDAQPVAYNMEDHCGLEKSCSFQDYQSGTSLETTAAGVDVAAGAGLSGGDCGTDTMQGAERRQADVGCDVRVPWWLRRKVVRGEHIVARGVTSGDASGVLPMFEPRLLVGVKKPVGALWASCTDTC